MRSRIRCMLVRGGTSQGAYFLAEDLPNDVEERDDLLLRIMGSPDPQQIDGIGGAPQLTSKVAIVRKSNSTQSDVDFLFAQVSVLNALVDTKPNCGNTLAGVGAFAIERGLVKVTGPETHVRVRTLNTGARSELVISTPNGGIGYDGVPGTSRSIRINFLDTAGPVRGNLFPTGKLIETIQGVDATCIDNGMPVVLLRAVDFGFTGQESCAEIEAARDSLSRIEAIRLEAGERMGFGNVSEAVVPKTCLISAPTMGGCINTRWLIQRKCHEAIGEFAAVSVATACVLPGSVAFPITVIPQGQIKTMYVEHPTGTLLVQLEMGGTAQVPTVERSGIIRTARALFDGFVFPRAKCNEAMSEG